ncbi:membrane-associated guanylate kinase, WW and PDZ domain-containing protein 1-like isoform X2 [Athalia rosae]|uniref:membrane-associated guanylate kinase, WW and PDZ domain-containing protein 1-like isoform X2 n=1 Tax=Athalia rosae TaxID=37344 RepID=UPI0020348D3D|nr:membrane-associated guanylate kinase, WW and PDZ domain-containing protein 1-like isoform X2 [Athalia rosae]
MAAKNDVALTNDNSNGVYTLPANSTINKESLKIVESEGSIHLDPPSYLYSTGSGQIIRDLEQEHGVHDRVSEDELGPLPLNWEKAYTDTGEVYFIDHNSGTSHWLDPRLSKFQKRSLEECLDDELPYGWEKIDDTLYGTYFIDHVNRRTQYENPVLQAKRAQQNSREPKSPVFTRNPEKLKGPRIRSTLLKGARGLGFTIVGGDDTVEEFLQIKSVVPNGPAWLDGKLQTGDVLVYVNDMCVLGYTHNEMVDVFKSISSGETVTLEVCRGYPLPFDPNDPNTEVVTTIAVNAPDMPMENSSFYMDVDPLLRNRERFNFVDGSFLPVHSMQNAEGMVTASVNSMPDLCISDKMATIKRPSSTDILLCDETRRVAEVEEEEDEDDNVNDHSNDNDNVVDSGEGEELKDQRAQNRGEQSQIYSEHPQPLLMSAKPEFLSISIVKGTMGFGFTIADSAHGQKVKKILDRQRCKNLVEGDILVDINVTNVRNMCHSEVVQVLKDCPRNREAVIHVQRTHKTKEKKERNTTTGLFRSKTPTADLYSTRAKTIVPSRPKTPLVDTRGPTHRPKTPTTDTDNSGWSSEMQIDGSSISDHPYRYTNLGKVINFSEPLEYRESITERLAENFALHTKLDDAVPVLGLDKLQWGAAKDEDREEKGSSCNDAYSIDVSRHDISGSNHNGGQRGDYYRDSYLVQSHERHDDQHLDYHTYSIGQEQNVDTGEIWGNRKESTSFEHDQPQHSGSLARYHQHYGSEVIFPVAPGVQWIETLVTLVRQNTGFGFRIVGGTEEGSQVSVGHIVPGGAADLDNRLITGDLIMSVDGESVMNSSHHHVVQLMITAAQNGRVTLGIRRRVNIQDGLQSYDAHQNPQYPYDISVSRVENEGFGFVIISSLNKAGSTIGRIIEGSPAAKCGQLNVGDHILAVNHVDIANVCHKDIVNLIKDSGYSVTLTIGYPLDDNCCSTPSLSQKDEQAGDGDGGQYHAVELTRGTRGFGFSIRGGREFQNMPLFVLQIADNGPASVDSRLRVGDQIIEINGINTKNMTHTEAIEIIRNGGPSVRLLVKRGCQMPPVVGASTHLYDMNI